MKKSRKYNYNIIAYILLFIVSSLFAYREVSSPSSRRGGNTSTGRGENPQIESYFSPDGMIMERILKELDNAQNSIDIAMYAFTKRELANGVIQAQKRGVKVRLLMDQLQSGNKYSKYTYFINNGIQPYLVSPMLHNKFAIIDEELVITGSYNWTANAEKTNHENILFIRNSPDTVRQFQEEFDKLWSKHANNQTVPSSKKTKSKRGGTTEEEPAEEGE